MYQNKFFNHFNENKMFFSIIFISGFLIRLVFFPYEIPITLDGIGYFLYAIELSRGNIFPEGFLINKFGWSIFLSPIFYIFQNSELLELMNIQRLVSIFISSATVIPTYYVIKKFFDSKIALIGSALFIFNPKIIENSVLGITDPLFIFLIFSSIMLILSKKIKFQIFSFFIGGLSFVVRPEGILIFLVLITVIFFRHEYNKKTIKCLFLGVLVFLGTLYISDLLITSGNEQISIFDRIYNFKNLDKEEISYGIEETGNFSNNFDKFLSNSISKFVIYSGWILMPNIIFFTFLSIIKIRKKISKNKILWFIIYLELSLTSFFAYGKNIDEVRYLFVLFLPILLFSSFGINFILNKIKNKIPILLMIIISSSGIFTAISMDDYNYERELIFAVNFLIDDAKGVNSFEGSRFMKSSELLKNWPKLPELGENLKMKMNVIKFPTENHSSIDEFVEENYKNGLTHILVKEKNGDPLFYDLFENEDKYSYLQKVFDYREHNFKNKILIFKITKNI